MAMCLKSKGRYFEEVTLQLFSEFDLNHRYEEFPFLGPVVRLLNDFCEY